MRQEFVGKVRLLAENGDFADWLDESLAQAKVNAGTHIEVEDTRTGKFFGIRPAPQVFKDSHGTPPCITFREMEVNAGLYPGQLHKGQTHHDIPVSKSHYRSVRQKVSAWRGVRHATV
jgi:hypothetical protein